MAKVHRYVVDLKASSIVPRDGTAGFASVWLRLRDNKTGRVIHTEHVGYVDGAYYADATTLRSAAWDMATQAWKIAYTMQQTGKAFRRDVEPIGSIGEFSDHGRAIIAAAAVDAYRATR